MDRRIDARDGDPLVGPTTTRWSPPAAATRPATSSSALSSTTPTFPSRGSPRATAPTWTNDSPTTSSTWAAMPIPPTSGPTARRCSSRCGLAPRSGRTTSPQGSVNRPSTSPQQPAEPRIRSASGQTAAASGSPPTRRGPRWPAPHPDGTETTPPTAGAGSSPRTRRGPRWPTPLPERTETTAPTAGAGSSPPMANSLSQLGGSCGCNTPFVQLFSC